MKKILKKAYLKLRSSFAVAFSFLCTSTTMASIIPTSNVEQASQSESIISTIQKVISQEFLPAVQLVIGMVAVLYSAFHIVEGLKQSKIEKCHTPLFHAIMQAAVTLIIVAVLIYLLGQA